MSLVGHEAVLITVASLAFAALVFSLVYIYVLDGSADSFNVQLTKNCGEPVYLSTRSAAFARAVGHHGEKARMHRAYRLPNMLLAASVAHTTERRRKREEQLAKAKTIDLQSM